MPSPFDYMRPDDLKKASEEAIKKMGDYIVPKPESKTQNETIIYAPHPDDEIIGCYEILQDPSISPIIIYHPDSSQDRKEEALKLKDHSNVKIQLFMHSIPTDLIDPTNKYFFPHPIYELNPTHREKGNVGEALLRSGYDVTFYSTEMNCPFKYECKTSDKKRELLNLIYPSQMDLWRYDYKYWLFSAYDKWIII